jgi:hypothetical protein
VYENGWKRLRAKISNYLIVNTYKSFQFPNGREIGNWKLGNFYSNSSSMSSHRYVLEPYKGMKTRFDCPACGQQKKFTRYIDTKTDEQLADHVGKCERESNCGYHYTPRQHFEATKTESFAPYRTSPKKVSSFPGDRKLETWKLGNFSERVAPTIPLAIFKASRKDYEHNAFIDYLLTFTDSSSISELISRYHIGTSKHWSGATVFWWVTPVGTITGGQVVLFGKDGHTAKYKNQAGKTIRYTRPVSKMLVYQYQQKNEPLPDWLTEYEQRGEKFPTLFGLHLLRTEPQAKPIAIAEAPATAIVASIYFPQFIWLAAGSLSWLNEKRLLPLQGRKVYLFPDLNAYQKWTTVASKYSHLARFTVSDFLEHWATDEERAQGLDLRDYLTRFPVQSFRQKEHSTPIDSPPIVHTVADQLAQPGSILKPAESQIEQLAVEPTTDYPPEWDEPAPLEAKPTIRSRDFFEWQRQSPPFNQLGLASLQINQPT